MKPLPKPTHPALPGTPLKRGPKLLLAKIPSREGWREAPGCIQNSRLLP
jgi:hypothetical protein